MNNLPTIVKDRIQKPVIAIGILSLVMISFLIHGDWKIAIVLLVFIAAINKETTQGNQDASQASSDIQAGMVASEAMTSTEVRSLTTGPFPPMRTAMM